MTSLKTRLYTPALVTVVGLLASMGGAWRIG